MSNNTDKQLVNERYHARLKALDEVVRFTKKDYQKANAEAAMRASLLTTAKNSREEFM